MLAVPGCQRIVSFLVDSIGIATPKALGSLGGAVLSFRFFRPFCGVTTALGCGDDCNNVPGPESGVSMPGIGT